MSRNPSSMFGPPVFCQGEDLYLGINNSEIVLCQHSHAQWIRASQKSPIAPPCTKLFHKFILFVGNKFFCKATMNQL